MNPGTGIGWSSTFMKEGIALLLLMMDSGTESRPGIREMRRIALSACSFDFRSFDAGSYCRGTDVDPGQSKDELFERCFRKWKSSSDLPGKKFDEWLDSVGSWVSLRVEAIMNANRQNYYRECAAFVAAYGEVLESRGKPGEKERIMMQYKKEYSMMRAFHNEMRLFQTQ